MTIEITKDNVKKKKERILIVDDEPDVNTVLESVFNQSGFNTDSYDNPIVALEQRGKRTVYNSTLQGW